MLVYSQAYLLTQVSIEDGTYHTYSLWRTAAAYPAIGIENREKFLFLTFKPIPFECLNKCLVKGDRSLEQ